MPLNSCVMSTNWTHDIQVLATMARCDADSRGCCGVCSYDVEVRELVGQGPQVYVYRQFIMRQKISPRLG